MASKCDTKHYMFVQLIWIGVVILLVACARYRINDLQHKLHKAEVCNKVFVKYLYYNYGLHINLDRLYEDGVKWVDDPQYQ